MKSLRILYLAAAIALVGPIAMAGQYQAAPGAGIPASGGKGPGMGHDYRRNVGGPGMGRGAQPPATAADIGHQPMAAPQPRPPGLGYQGYPNPAAPGMNAPHAGPGQSRGQGRGQGYGYGYPGYRGRGGEGYPGHRQYGNPPRAPSAPPASQ